MYSANSSSVLYPPIRDILVRRTSFGTTALCAARFFIVFWVERAHSNSVRQKFVVNRSSIRTVVFVFITRKKHIAQLAFGVGATDIQI